MQARCRALLKYTQRYALSLGCHKLILCSDFKRENAHALYESKALINCPTVRQSVLRKHNGEVRIV